MEEWALSLSLSLVLSFSTIQGETWHRTGTLSSRHCSQASEDLRWPFYLVRALLHIFFSLSLENRGSSKTSRGGYGIILWWCERHTTQGESGETRRRKKKKDRFSTKHKTGKERERKRAQTQIWAEGGTTLLTFLLSLCEYIGPSQREVCEELENSAGVQKCFFVFRGR